MGEIVRGEVRPQDIELAIRIKRGEAHTHESLAEGFESRAQDHRGYAQAYYDQIAELEAQLANGSSEVAQPDQLSDSSVRTSQVYIEGPETSFS